MEKKHNSLTGLIYASILPSLQSMARELGYAIAIHGSMKRDFDLIAVPWIDDARPAEELIQMILKLADFYSDIAIDGPTMKPHGRRSWAITIGGGLYFDISIMPLTSNAGKETE